MKPLTIEELHAIKKSATGNDAMSALVRRLCELAERSIPRPISEAPRDGKMIVGRIYNGDWRVCWRGSGHAEWTDGRVSILQVVEFIPIPEPTDGTV